MAWMAEEAVPTASMGLAAAVSDAPPTGSGQWVYAVGGTNSSNVLASVAGYDTVQKKWSARPSMPTARSGVAAATSPGRTHVLGGFDQGSNFLTTHEVYEPANDAWSTAAPLPSARAILAAVTGPDGLIYAIGGFDGNPLATVDAYDPATDKWTSKASMHSPRTWHAAVVGHDGLIYAMGGGIPAMQSSMETFNVKTNTWTTSSFSLPVATCGIAAAVDPNGLICVIGATPDRVARPPPTSTATTRRTLVGSLSPQCRVGARHWPRPPVPTASFTRSAAPMAPTRWPPSRHSRPISVTPSSRRSQKCKANSATRRATWEIFPHRIASPPRGRSSHWVQN